LTTQVQILNKGPERVRVEVQGRDDKGHFTPAHEVYVNPWNFTELYVHSTQSIQIIEDPEPYVAPAAVAAA
jgi:hypothetical protein